MKRATRWKAIFATALVAVVLWGVAEVAAYDPDRVDSTDTSQPVQPLPEATWDPPLPPVQRPTPTPEPTAEESKAEVERKAEPEPAAPAPAPQPEPEPAPKAEPKPAGPPVVTLSPITAFESQAAVDTGALVTWFDPGVWGLCLLAGHDNMGWYWLDDLAVGTIVRVTQGPCTGEYEVGGHERQPVKGGKAPDWMWNYDLILQTCTGSSGTGFSLAMRR